MFTPLLVAISFLTVFPVTLRKSPTERDFSNSRAYFPVVGLLLGGLLVGLEWGVGELFPVYLTSAMLLVLLVVVTRGFHLDGFMDVCDGLFGGHTAEHRLEIMRDSHVGAFAVAGGASLLILKYGALLSLLVLAEESNHGKEWALFLFPMLSRWAMVVATVAFPYARRQGMGTPFHQGSTKLVAAIAAVVVIIASLFLGGIGGAGMLIGVSILAWALGLIMAHMLGGLTGDAYGAINEMAEVAILVAAVALIQYGLLEPLPQLLGGS